MRAIAATLTAIALTLAACGSDDGGSGGEPTTFPAGKINPAGNYYVPVSDQAEADRLCSSAQEAWPDEYAEYDQVTFDLPNTGSDVTCVRAG
jgi:hypothetical protein